MNRASPAKLLIAILIALMAAAVVVPAAASAQGNRWTWSPRRKSRSVLRLDPVLRITPRLREIETSSNRVKVDVIGQSAGGRNLFLVTISDPQAMGRLGQYKAISNQMLKDPAKAQAMIEKFGDFKVPVFINGSIHGGEYPGTDTAMRLIEQFAYSNDPEVLEVLKNEILLINVCQNPDGRVAGTRDNANGIDVNRDFYTQSQPESRITAGLLADWNPMILLDLHGFVDPMLIEPCTPPHNPNYEYDLYIKWALAQAEAMEANLFANTGFLAQIPYRDFDLGWDDWPPSYTPMFAMYHGAYGHTLETPYRDYRGVDAQYHAVWGALDFVAQNRAAMLHDHRDLPPRLPGPATAAGSSRARPGVGAVPGTHVAGVPGGMGDPKAAPFQVSPHQAARLVDFLLYNDVDVEQASKAFAVDGVTYPAGTYVVWMNQPKRGLANVLLDDGLDLSGISGLFFYSPPSTWSNPLLWGTKRVMMEDKVAVSTRAISKADAPRGSSEGGKAAAYAFLPTSISAVQATNELLRAAWRSRGRDAVHRQRPQLRSWSRRDPGDLVARQRTGQQVGARCLRAQGRTGWRRAAQATEDRGLPKRHRPAQFAETARIRVHRGEGRQHQRGRVGRLRYLHQPGSEVDRPQRRRSSGLLGVVLRRWQLRRPVRPRPCDRLR